MQRFERERSRVLHSLCLCTYIICISLALPSCACIKYHRDALEKLRALHSPLPLCQMMPFINPHRSARRFAPSALYYRVIYPACFSLGITRLGVNQKHQIPARLMDGQCCPLLSEREKNSSGKRERPQGLLPASPGRAEPCPALLRSASGGDAAADGSGEQGWKPGERRCFPRRGAPASLPGVRVPVPACDVPGLALGCFAGGAN